MTSIGGNLLGKAVKIRGDITGAEDLQFDGELEGSLNLGSSKLTLGPSARVRAQITAQEVIVNGRVDGDIYATGLVQLRKGSVVQGDVYSGGITIEQDAAFRGRVEPMPAKNAVPVERATLPIRSVTQPIQEVAAPAAEHQTQRLPLTPVTAMRPQTLAETPTQQPPARQFGHMPAALAAAAHRPLEATETDDAVETNGLLQFADRQG